MIDIVRNHIVYYWVLIEIMDKDARMNDRYVSGKCFELISGCAVFRIISDKLVA